MNDSNVDMPFKQKKIAIQIGCILASFFGTSSVLAAIPNDLNIYKQPRLGKTNLLLMIDSTAGMDDAQTGRPTRSIALDYPNCASRTLKAESTTSLDKKYQAVHSLRDASGAIKPTFVYPMPYCDDGTGEYKYSRMDRMKVAMTKLLSSTDISDDVNVGMGQFSAQTSKEYVLDTSRTAENNMTHSLRNVTQYFYTLNDQYQGLGGGTGVSAKILLPTEPLSLEQRWKMRVAVNALNSGGRTPLAAALAESGAYMLGKTTLNADRTSPGPESIYGQYSLNSDGIRRGTYFSASGFNHSIDAAKNGSVYRSPIQNDAQVCNSNGVFLLTNAAPSQTQRDVAEKLMQNALGDPNFRCPVDNTSGLMKKVGADTTDYGWTCMGAFAKRLKESDQKIRVAVAGFGNNFAPYRDPRFSTLITDANGKQRRYYKCNDLTVGSTYTVEGITTKVTQDTINACNLGEKINADAGLNAKGQVGGYGEGGFYPIVSPDNLIDSIKNFVADLQTNIPSLNSGIPGIPIDPLNAYQQLPFAYSSQFQPNTLSSQAKGIWLGNIKKYQVVDNTFKDKNSNNVVNATTGNLESTTDFWSSSPDSAQATNGGALAKLPVQTVAGRKIYTNRDVSSGTESEIVSTNTALKLIDSKNTSDSTGTAEALRASTDLNQTNAYLLNLLGFGVSTPNVPASLANASLLRQMGATINSTPLMFTTKSQIAVKSTQRTENGISVTYNPGDYIDRKDYILFGTNQGLVQVVDASTGEEKFAFLPHEMIQKQKKGFISKSLQEGEGYSDLYQGVDGAWSVYANYTADTESNSLKAEQLNVYGGLRRGGTSYYGLDLKNIETGAPKMLFKIGPSESGACSANTPLNCMGQSWSKPVIASVKWKGKPQLVMIVGGGYDPVFDAPNYKANTDATKGNGVYIFAANSNEETGLDAGELMWWGSSSASTIAAGTDKAAQTQNDYLKYSVVSEIKTVDRDSDGFVDNLYFGDLGGQLFRIDIDNIASTDTQYFNVKRVVRIGNFIDDSVRATKTAPRFYFKPTFTTHRINKMAGIVNATRYAVISIGSGDQSSPIYNGLTTSNGEPDRVYGVFDRDVGRTDLFTLSNDAATTDGLVTGTASTTTMLDLAITTGENAASLENMQKATTKGWFNTLTGDSFGASTNLDSSAVNGVARYKVLSAFSAVNNTLFTSYYDAADNGSFSSCDAGIKGRSFIKNYCLPFGNMNAEGENCGTSENGRSFSTATTKGIDAGLGNVPVIIGGMKKTGGGIVIGLATAKPQASGVLPQFGTPIRFEPIRWAEKIS